MSSKTFENIFGDALTNYPPVSIGIPTYNGSNRIGKSLQSLWDQHYPNLEIIISDNCSNDGTEGLCRRLMREHSEIRYYRQKSNIGLVGNFEFVLKNATGKYFMWLSDDDTLQPGALRHYVKFLQNNPAYSIVSGAIQYWKGDTPSNVESGFTFEQSNPELRVIGYYKKVVYGGMFHGLMRRHLGVSIPCRNVFGNDYHFVASLAFLGKLKNFNFTGYNKWFGGTSRDNKKYAIAIGESKFTGYFPHLKMAYDAFAEIVYRSPIYDFLPLYRRIATGFASAMGILYCYGFTILPFTVGGKIKRLLLNSIDAVRALASRVHHGFHRRHQVSHEKHNRMV